MKILVASATGSISIHVVNTSIAMFQYLKHSPFYRNIPMPPFLHLASMVRDILVPER